MRPRNMLYGVSENDPLCDLRLLTTFAIVCERNLMSKMGWRDVLKGRLELRRSDEQHVMELDDR